MSFVESQKFNIESKRAREGRKCHVNEFPVKTVSYGDVYLGLWLILFGKCYN